MISHDEFARLRLASFLPGVELAELTDWEFEERTWVGEALGRSEWLRLEGEPDRLGSMAIDFATFPASAATEALRTIDLPLRPGMAAPEVRAVLGEPIKEYRFADDRVSYEFLTPGPSPYAVSCTILHEGGLRYLVVMRPLPELDEEEED